MFGKKGIENYRAHVERTQRKMAGHIQKDQNVAVEAGCQSSRKTRQVWGLVKPGRGSLGTVARRQTGQA